MHPEGRASYRVGKAVVTPALNAIARDGKTIYLRHQVMQVLLYLLEHRDQYVSKQELFDAVWKDTAVTDDALVQCIVEIRKALGDDARLPRYIRTIPKLGYQCVASVEELKDAEPLPAEPVAPPLTVAVTDSIAGPQGATAPARAAASTRTYGGAFAVIAAGLLLAVGFALWSLAGSSDNSANAAGSLPPVVDGHRVVAIVPFANESQDRDLDWLREGLPNMLITGLARQPELTVTMTPPEGEHGEGARPDARRASAIAAARRARASVVIVGSFARIGRAIRVDLHLYAPQSGQLLGAHHLTVDDPERLLGDVDLLALRVGATLGAPARTTQRLSDVLTDSLEAYRAYSLALEKADAYDSDGALDLLRQATALDPEFAMAYARVGYIYAMVRVFEKRRALPYLEKAFALANRLTEKDRLFIQAWNAEAHDDFERAIESWREISRHYPTEMEAYRRMAACFSALDRTAEARATLERAVAIDPDAADLWNSLGFAHLAFGEHAKAVAAHERYVALDPLEANAHDSLGITLSQAGRWEEALAALDRALALRPDFHFAVLHKGDVFFQMGRYLDAIALYEHAARLAPSDWDRAMAYNHLALARWRRGDIAAAMAAARQEIAFQNDFGTELRLALHLRDDRAISRLRVRYFGDGVTPPRGKPAGTTREPLYLRGLLALHEHRADDALKYFAEALRIPKVIWGVNSVEDCLAQAYVALGRLEDAVAEYERIVALEPRGALNIFRLADLHDRLGHRDEASSRYAEFLELWKGADQDLPEVQRGRERLNALTS